jgi:hypothetical protein
MHFLYQKISGGWPFLVVGLLLICLWGTLLFSSPSSALSVDQQNNQATYGLTLPNIMAPVIRKEVNKEPMDEEDKMSVSRIRLPNLWQLMKGWK